MYVRARVRTRMGVRECVGVRARACVCRYRRHDVDKLYAHVRKKTIQYFKL